MATVFLEFVGQVDDADGFEGAFFDAYPATATECFRYDGFATFNAYGFYFAAHHRAEANAQGIALLDFAFIFI